MDSPFETAKLISAPSLRPIQDFQEKFDFGKRAPRPPDGSRFTVEIMIFQNLGGGLRGQDPSKIPEEALLRQ
jgi:hypothetical protein